MSDAPPDYAIEAARNAALRSPCQKSQRGVAAFSRESADAFERSPPRKDGAFTVRQLVVTGIGFNGPPKGFLCDGSEACRTDCAKFCLHAEHRAIRAAGILDDVGDLELVHVKVVLGKVVAGGPPSCWQCSREILDVGVRGVWLYEDVVEHIADVGPHVVQPAKVWRYYTALEFHCATLKNCGIAGAPT